LALLAQEALEPVGLPIHVITEHVDLSAGNVAVDLEPRHQRDAVPRRLVERVRYRVGGVVIGDRQGADSLPGRQADQLPRRQRAVGRGGVGVQVGAAQRPASVRYVRMVRTAYPVAPFGASGVSFSRNAGPAMSRWAHGLSPANSLRKSPAL